MDNICLHCQLKTDDPVLTHIVFDEFLDFMEKIEIDIEYGLYCLDCYANFRVIYWKKENKFRKS